MSKVVIFDWGGVVESHENDMQDLKLAKIRMLRRFSDALSDEEILKGFTDVNSKGAKMGTSNNKEEIIDWINLIQKNWKINVPIEDFILAYEEEGRKVKYYKDVVDFAHSLKGRCKLAILSNLLPIDKKRIDEQYDLSYFDKVYLSFEMGLSKPNKKVYDYVIKDLQVLPKEILFIDDDKKNIEMAKKAGWQTCQAFGYELDKIKKAVEDFLNISTI